MNQAEISVKVASTIAEINSLRDFWTKLNYHPEADIDFVLMLASVRPEILRPYILVAYGNDEKPVALMVGRIEKTLTNIRIGYLTLFKIPLTQLVFVRDGYLGGQSESIANAMVEEIGKALRVGDADRALLCSLPINGTLHNYIRFYFHVHQRNYSRKIGEHWKISLPNDFDALLKKKSKKRRDELRRAIRVFEKQYKGKVKYEIFSEHCEVNSFCSAAETVAKTTYQRGLGTGFVDNEENRERLELAARKGWFRAYVVFVEDKPLAFWSGEREGDVIYLTWTGFDPSYRKYAVGTILFLKMIEDLFTQGIKKVDYGLGGAQYKERFGDQCVREEDIDIYAPTLKGYSINSIITMMNVVNRVGKRIIVWLKISDKVKRIWRANLRRQSKVNLVNLIQNRIRQGTTSETFIMLKKNEFFQSLMVSTRKIESIAGDWFMNVKTGMPVFFSHARGINGDAFDFETNAHSTIIKAIRLVRLTPSDVVFVLGCGRGRAVCHFARQYIRKVVGIELEPRLCDAAKKNGKSLRGRKAEIEIQNIDAASADIREGSVFFMFNPFGEQTLRTVLKNIEATRDVTSKSTTIIYVRPIYSYVFSEFTWLNALYDYKSLLGLHVIVYRNRLS